MNAKYIVKEPTCFKSLSIPVCIDLVMSILKEIINLLDTLITKEGPSESILTRHIKDVSDICSPILANIWNEEILF